MHIAVTGGQGSLGRVLVPYLLEQGHTVISLDRVSPGGLVHDGVKHWVADARDFGHVVAALQGCDAVIHLAGHVWPWGAPPHVVYLENVSIAYNVLEAAAALGIERVVQASSVNAVGMAFSRNPRFDYFPVDEAHPSYAEDPYSLSKWVLEEQAQSFVRAHKMRIASLRFHWLLPSYEEALTVTRQSDVFAWRHLWAYTDILEGARACERAVLADFDGHEAFFIAAPRTAAEEPTLDLIARHYPGTPLRAPLADRASPIDSSKAARLLGWVHP